ncbi:MAG: hypothetical protein BWZ10_02333 [candidate division BRC1 bacterium ADurb.BinA364]|nr:MAG: hypothetical protein BWZ10_02333 [candidate division BRC1 bacterium ADurb.BinA364]
MAGGLEKEWIEKAMAGNPLGQKSEQTPIGIVRVEGPAAAESADAAPDGERAS